MTALRAPDPTINAWCPDHPDLPSGRARIHVFDRNPASIAAAYVNHDRLYHNPDAWAVGGTGGNGGDICAPCAGYGRDDKKLERGQRHDLCFAGRYRGRGNDCGCTHNKPDMWGVVLGPDGKWMTRRPETPAPAADTTNLIADTTPHTADLFEDFA